MEYKILTDSTWRGLEKQVLIWCGTEGGWKPHGGVSVTVVPNRTWFHPYPAKYLMAQAITLE